MFVILINGMTVLCFAEEQAVIDLACPSAILMERSTGEVLYTKDADTSRPLASVTKIMTMLLVMEAIADGKISLTDIVVCSENASKKGGSQIWLEPNEEMTVNDLLKATAIG